MFEGAFSVDMLPIHEHMVDLRHALIWLFNELNGVMIYDLDSSTKCKFEDLFRCEVFSVGVHWKISVMIRQTATMARLMTLARCIFIGVT